MRRAKLIEARKAAGKTQEQVAEAVEVDRTTIGNWERGNATPHPHQRLAYAEAIQISLSELHAILSSLPVTDEVAHWAHVYFAMEQSATEIRAHEPGVVYGLLQTPDYAAAIARAVGTTPPDDSYIEWIVKTRKARQQRVHSGELAVVALQPEFPLHLRMGSAAVMAEQMATLVELCDLPNVTVQIVPYDVGYYEALRFGIFALMLHPWRPALSVHIEGYAGARLVDDTDEVAYFAAAFEHAQGLALSPSKSQELIAKKGQEWQAAV